MFIKEIGGVKLAANGFTFIKYKAYSGRDLLKDITLFNQRRMETLRLVEKYGDTLTDETKFGALPDDERNQIYTHFADNAEKQSFLIDLCVALVAAADDNPRTREDIARQIPVEWITSGTDEFAQLMEIIDGMLPGQKKTLQT